MRSGGKEVKDGAAEAVFTFTGNEGNDGDSPEADAAVENRFVTDRIIAECRSRIENNGPLTSFLDMAEKDEQARTFALLILCALLLVALFTSYFLHYRRIRTLHESLVSLLSGALVGLILRLANSHAIQDYVSFDHAYFFNLLLPPIILNSGYEMKRSDFFRNFGTILTFAFLGTFISALVTGLFSWAVSLTGITGVRLSLLESLQVGSVLSATDPVTVLAIFSHLHVDPKLYAIIFGESMLNDAVAIVMFETLRAFQGQNLESAHIYRGLLAFFTVFFSSLSIGVFIALLLALLLKHTLLRSFPSTEASIVCITTYATYLLANGLGWSGIVALLFCGLTLRHYAYDNLSLRGRRTTKYVFRLLAQLSENFIFIYLGLTLFTAPDGVFRPILIFFTLLFVIAGRYAAVFPISSVINAWSRYIMRRPHDPLIPEHQFMLFWAGLRGAVAFALASAFEGTDGAAVRTAILWVVVISILVFGGTTMSVVDYLRLSSQSNSDEINGNEYEDTDQEDRKDLERFDKDDTHWFLGLDDRWIKPFFARPVKPGERTRPIHSTRLHSLNGNSFRSDASSIQFDKTPSRFDYERIRDDYRSGSASPLFGRISMEDYEPATSTQVDFPERPMPVSTSVHIMENDKDDSGDDMFV